MSCEPARYIVRIDTPDANPDLPVPKGEWCCAEHLPAVLARTDVRYIVIRVPDAMVDGKPCASDTGPSTTPPPRGGSAKRHVALVFAASEMGAVLRITDLMAYVSEEFPVGSKRPSWGGIRYALQTMAGIEWIDKPKPAGRKVAEIDPDNIITAR